MIWAWILASSVARGGDVEWTYAGMLQTDIRYGIEDIDVGTWYAPLGQDPGFIRNQNLFKNKVNAKSGKRQFFMDADLVLMGFPDEIDSTYSLSRREIVDPFRIEFHSAYMEAWDLGLRGLDLRVGQQKVQWGVGDQFNPTNNLNSDDLEDPLLFGDQLGNVMVRLDYTPIQALSFSGVVVPVFKPALLPQTGRIALGLTDRIPVADNELRRELFASNQLVEEYLKYPTVVDGVSPVLPENNIQNMQWMLRMAGTIGMQDLALSYYNGRFDFPVATGNHTSSQTGEMCNPADEEDCINGLLKTVAEVSYPKMQVYGLNAAGEMNPLGWIHNSIQPIGYRLEFAWIHPEETRMSVTNDELNVGIVQPAGEYDYGLPGGQRPIVIPKTSFFKWTLGLDYSFGRHVYLNAQWVHGMPDEFGAGDWITPGYTARAATFLRDEEGTPLCGLADIQGETCVKETMRPRIGDYGVLGFDLTFGQTRMRMFTILDFTPILITTYDTEKEERVEQRYAWHTEQGRSMVLYPEINHNFGNGFELAGGAVVMVGEDWTKFGDPATGGTQIFTRAKYSF